MKKIGPMLQLSMRIMPTIRSPGCWRICEVEIAPMRARSPPHSGQRVGCGVASACSQLVQRARTMPPRRPPIMISGIPSSPPMSIKIKKRPSNCRKLLDTAAGTANSMYATIPMRYRVMNGSSSSCVTARRCVMKSRARANSDGLRTRALSAANRRPAVATSFRACASQIAMSVN